MQNVIDILLKFDGLIGAVLGVIATLITTEMLKKTGKLYVYVHEENFELYSGETDKFGGPLSVGEFEKASYGLVRYKLQLYNGSDIPKSFRNIQLKFSLQQKQPIYVVPKDEATRRTSGPITFTDELTVLNIPPKQFIEKDLKLKIGSEIKEFSALKSVKFEANKYNGHRVSIKIK